MLEKEKLFKIGIGTWKIDYENFENDIDGLIHSYNLGQNYLSLYMLYNNGKVVREMKKFLDKIDRDKIEKEVKKHIVADNIAKFIYDKEES